MNNGWVWERSRALVSGVGAILVTLASLVGTTALAGESEGLGGHRIRARTVAADVDGISGRGFAQNGDGDGVIGMPGDRDNVNGHPRVVVLGDGDSVTGYRTLQICGDVDGISGYVSLLYWSPGWLR